MSRDRTIDEVMGALKDRDRRLILSSLELTSSGRISVEELVDLLHSERDSSSGSDDSEAHVVEVSLKQVHLPLLDDLGLASFDRESGVVEAREEPIVSAALEIAADIERLPSNRCRTGENPCDKVGPN